jgi:hypothetical protein
VLAAPQVLIQHGGAQQLLPQRHQQLIWSTNHGSTPEAAATCSTSAPRRSARTRCRRAGRPWRAQPVEDVIDRTLGIGPVQKPARLVSSDRRPCRAPR